MKKLSNHIIKKYNNLFKEIALYYKIPNTAILLGENNLSVVYVNYLGFKEPINNKKSYQDFIEFLKNSYKYFVPFYWFYFSNVRWLEMTYSNIIFIQMNECIEEIREINIKNITAELNNLDAYGNMRN